jgi:hypothetical protein
MVDVGEGAFGEVRGLVGVVAVVNGKHLRSVVAGR